MKQKKRELSLYSYYDFSGIARHLEDMAHKGWQLERIGGQLWHYRRREPVELRYAVVYFAKASDLDTAPSQDQQSFWEMCRAAGWELVANRGVMQVFRNPDPNAVPVETDPVVQVDNIHAAMKKTLCLSYAVLLACALVQILMSCKQIFRDLRGVLASPFDLFSIFIWAGLALYCTAELLSYFLWLRKARTAAREEGILLTPKGHPWRQAALLAASGVYALVILVSMLGLFGFASVSPVIVLFGLVYASVLLLSIHGSQWLMRRMGVSPVTNRVLSAVIGIAAGFALLFGSFKLITSGISPAILGHANAETISYTREGRTYTYDFYRDSLPLTVEDLSGMEPDPDYSRRMDVSGTPLLREYDIRQVIPYYSYSDAPELTYTVWEVGIGSLYEPVKNSFFKDTVYTFHGQIDFVIPHGWVAADAAPWGALDAYQYHDEDGQPYGSYLLCYDSRFVEISFDAWNTAPPTAEQMTLVGKVLGSGSLA